MAFVSEHIQESDDREEGDGVASVRRARAANPEPTAISDADREALMLFMRLAKRAAVARSFARLAAGVVQRTIIEPHVQRARTVARAAAAAAVHVGANEVQRWTAAEQRARETPEGEPSP